MQTNGKKVVRHRCVGCGKEHRHGLTTFCDCGAMIDVEYDLAAVRLHDTPDPYHRYFDLLPIEDPANLLPVAHGPTPIRHATKLGRHLGLQELYLKDETALPTGTTKDRMAITVLSFFREIGIREFTAASTGNSSTSLATYVRHLPGSTLYLFSAEDFLDRLRYEECDQVVLFAMRGASFVEACDEAAAFAKRVGVTGEGGFFNPARREGLKTAFLEAAEQLPRPADWYVQAVSSAMGVYGVYKGARELAAMGRLNRLPRLLCVQQESCAPMARAFQDNSSVIRARDIVTKPKGIAEAILRGNPTRVYPYVRRIVRESQGTILAVSETEIREARRMIEDLEGVSPCFTASTAIAGLVRSAKAGRIPVGDTILVNLTGSDRQAPKPLKNIHWLERADGGWRPEDSRDSAGVQLWEGAGRVSAPTIGRITKIVAQIAGPGETLGADTVLGVGGLDLDSVTTLELLVAMEKEFSIEIPADALQQTEALRTIGSLARFIESRIPPAK